MNYQRNPPIYYLSFQLEESEFFLYIEKHASNIKETYEKYEYVRNAIFENLEPEIYTLQKDKMLMKLFNHSLKIHLIKV